MTRPNFLIVGAQKGGTTTLYRWLAQHPDIYMSEVKEPAFFVQEMGWRQGWGWYESLFSDGASSPVRGEASTAYTMFPQAAGVAGRIAEALEDVRIVYAVRDPVERMRSSYQHALAAGAEHRPIDVALVEDSRYSDTSRYWMQISQFLSHLPPERMLLVQSEHLGREPGPQIDRVLAHLGLAAGWRPADLDQRYLRSEGARAPRLPLRVAGSALIRTMARTGWAPRGHFRGPPVNRWTTRRIHPHETSVPDELRERLRDALRSDVERLVAEFGAPLDGWGMVV